MRDLEAKGSNVVCKVVDAGQTEGGLHIPEMSKSFRQLIVTSVGEDVKKFAVGDSLCIPRAFNTFQIPDSVHGIYAVFNEAEIPAKYTEVHSA